MTVPSDARVDEVEKLGARAQVQRFGTFLSNMVMPNIGAFIAWGFITALFIKAGWINLAAGGTLPADSWVAQLGGWGVDPASCAEKIMNAAGDKVALPAGAQSCSSYGGIVGPMITYLLPILIGYTGGRNMYREHATRGGVVGAIATFGVIAGTSIPMFMGAMIMGPLGGWTMKHIDHLWAGKIKPGFEMLIDNFSAGIWGMILALVGFFGMSHVVTAISTVLGNAVQFLVDTHMLPLTSLLIEPAKVLFLNNAINHGVLTPLGMQQAQQVGKSVLFLLEANPGPGLGLLLAYTFFGKGAAKASASGAALIHFVGGIHEIYFPYVLMKPIMILATIAGGMTGVALNVMFGSGLRSPAAPGSIIAIYASAAPDSFLGITIAVLGATAVSFLVGAVLLKFSKDDEEADLSKATADMEAMKGKKSAVAATLTGAAAAPALAGPVKTIVFACDAGMGSSAMGASVLRKKIKDAGFGDVSVTNQAIANLTDTYDIIVTHKDLARRAALLVPSATMFTVDNFMGSPVYDDVVAAVSQANGGGATASAVVAAPVAATVDAPAKPRKPRKKLESGVLTRDAIKLGLRADSKDDALRQSGDLLVSLGAAGQEYADAMFVREGQVSTYMGNGVVIPHGTNDARDHVYGTKLGFLQFPDGVDWNGQTAYVAIPIASNSNEHVGILSALAGVLADKKKAEILRTTTSVDEVLELLAPDDED